MASTRLRTTFKYPSDDEDHSDNSRDEMDEEEQEDLLTQFRTQDTDRNVLYTLIFTLLPIATLPGFLFYLLGTSTGRTGRLLCLLGMTSLAVSAFCMRFLPPGVLQSAKSKQRNDPAYTGLMSVAANVMQRLDAVDKVIDIDPAGPLPRYLPYLNSAVSALLVLAAWTVRSRGNAPEGFWLFLLMPGVMWAMVSVARQGMSEVQKEIGGLERLKYGLKGA